MLFINLHFYPTIYHFCMAVTEYISSCWYVVLVLVLVRYCLHVTNNYYSVVCYNATVLHYLTIPCDMSHVSEPKMQTKETSCLLNMIALCFDCWFGGSICVCIRVLRGAGQPARVAGTRICGAGAGTRTAMRAGRDRVVLGAGAGAGAGWESLWAGTDYWVLSLST